MTSRHKLIAFAAAASLAAVSLAACETDTYGASAGASTSSADQLKPACRPGDTEAGTRSGLACNPGSSTGTPTGSDANVKGAASTGSAPAVPSTQ